MNIIIKILVCFSIVLLFLIGLSQINNFSENPISVLIPILLSIVFLIIVIKNWESYQL